MDFFRNSGHIMQNSSRILAKKKYYMTVDFLIDSEL